MVKDPFDKLRSKLEGSVGGFDELGTEADPDDSAEYLVATVDESEFDEAASIAESEGFDEITTEQFGGDFMARFGRKK